MNKPLFVSFEGGEGAGKTTVIEKLYYDLQDKGYNVIKTREPGGSPLSEKIRHLLLDGEVMGFRAELLLFLASRAQHVEQLIKPALTSGNIVLCDRFLDSSVAYQGYARGLGMEAVEELSLFSTAGLKPHITFYLDLDPVTGIHRRRDSDKGSLDRIEQETLDFHRKVREGFLKQQEKEKQRIHLIDATQSKESVYFSVFQVVLDALK